MKYLNLNPQFQILVLSNTNLSPVLFLFQVGLRNLIHGIAKNDTLVSLDVSNNNLGIEGARVLTEFPDGCKLEELIYSKNNMGDEGAIIFS